MNIYRYVCILNIINMYSVCHDKTVYQLLFMFEKFNICKSLIVATISRYGPIFAIVVLQKQV